ncbi:MAG: hypothetical protein J6V44_05370 [Methanobrevibacter sp.]|nr:hypothetical protein [Methanobrevibacter sp.]
MDNKKEFYITIKQQDEYIDVQNIVGKVEFLDTPDSKMLLEVIKRGKDITIKPFGYGTRDKDGNIKDFTLTGFTIF